jgi:hypothetical protein
MLEGKQVMPEFATDEEYDAYIADVQLPNWLVAALPEHKPHSIISYADDAFHVSTSNDTFDSIETAYDWLRSETDFQVVFDDSVNGHGGKLTNGMFFGDLEERSSGGEGGRLLMSYTSEDSLDFLKYDYRVWLDEINPAYEVNSENWLVAYNWLNHHPIFWKKATEEPSADWETDIGLDDVHVHVSMERSPAVRLETGEHVEPHYTRRYWDVRLDSLGATFEEAYVVLAKKVNLFYAPDGAERENVQYEPSEYELRLKATVENLTEK